MNQPRYAKGKHNLPSTGLEPRHERPCSSVSLYLSLCLLSPESTLSPAHKVQGQRGAGSLQPGASREQKAGVFQPP